MELARGERPCTVEWEPEGVSSPDGVGGRWVQRDKTVCLARNG